MLYWGLSSLVGVVQQYFVMKKAKEEMEIKPNLHKNKPLHNSEACVEDEDDEDEFDDLISYSIEPAEQVVQSAGVIINGDVTVIRDSVPDLMSDELVHGDFLDDLFTEETTGKLVVEQTALDAVKVSTPNELGKIIVNNNEDYAVSKVEIIVLSDGQPVGYLVSGE